MTYKAAFGYVLATIGSVVGAAWLLRGDIGAVREDVAQIKGQLAQITRVTEANGGDMSQAQYVLVEVPSHTARDELVRQVLLKKGEIDATP